MVFVGTKTGGTSAAVGAVVQAGIDSLDAAGTSVWMPCPAIDLNAGMTPLETALGMAPTAATPGGAAAVSVSSTRKPTRRKPGKKAARSAKPKRKVATKRKKAAPKRKPQKKAAKTSKRRGPKKVKKKVARKAVKRRRQT